MKRLFLVFSLFLGSFSVIQADTTAADFLLLNPNACLAALGDAGVSYDGLTAVFFNPASLGGSEPREVQFSYVWWFEEIKANQLTFGFSPSDNESLSIEYFRLDYGAIPRIDIQENVYESYQAQDERLGITYCQQILGDVFSEESAFLGGTFKFIQQKIESVSASGYALDVGIRYSQRIFGNWLFPLGFSISNLGSEIKFIRTGAKLPLTLRLGTILKLKKQLIVPVELSYSYRGTNEKLNFHLGTEYKYEWRNYQFYGRFGWRSDVLTNLDWFNGFTFGAGLNWVNYGLVLDYAFVPYGLLGNTSRITLALKF